MKLKITPLKVIRFDFNPTYIENDFLNFDSKTLIRYEIGKSPIGENWFGVRWSINFIEKTEKDEIFDHLSEMRALYEIENKLKDKNDIKQFLKDSYINVEMYYQEHAPQKYIHLNLSQPDFDKAAAKLFSLIEQANKYS